VRVETQLVALRKLFEGYTGPVARSESGRAVARVFD
jgi:hypothetical protein